MFLTTGKPDIKATTTYTLKEIYTFTRTKVFTPVQLYTLCIKRRGEDEACFPATICKGNKGVAN